MLASLLVDEKDRQDERDPSQCTSEDICDVGLAWSLGRTIRHACGRLLDISRAPAATLKLSQTFSQSLDQAEILNLRGMQTYQGKFLFAILCRTPSLSLACQFDGNVRS